VGKTNSLSFSSATVSPTSIQANGRHGPNINYIPMMLSNYQNIRLVNSFTDFKFDYLLIVQPNQFNNASQWWVLSIFDLLHIKVFYHLDQIKYIILIAPNWCSPLLNLVYSESFHT